MMEAGPSSLLTGVVVIGRNEGQRLVRCLEFLRPHWGSCVYVDSGSTDDSAAVARSRGVEVIDLDMSIPFTAARARNAGARRLMDLQPALRYVQFVDGDCEVQPGWIESGEAFLEATSEVGVVFGAQREKYPQASVYNTLMDIEWRVAPGEARSSTGNALCRARLFRELGGFREDLIAGEDPDFCLRVRSKGWKVWCLAVPMVLHDADMKHLSQWWRRARRAGYAYAEGAVIHGRSPERYCVRERNSMLFWGCVLPLVAVGTALFISPWLLALLAAYPLQVVRMLRSGRWTFRENLIYALFTVLGKFPESQGLVEYYRRRGRAIRLIEYK
jgi:GT2 family glycosyltransferase